MTVAETVSVCACGAPLYEGETRCEGCVLADTPWAERVAVLRDALREAGVVPLDDVPVSPWGPDAAREVALYRVLCTGALRTLAEYALEHRPYPPEPVLEVREGRLGYTARVRIAPQRYRFERVDVGIYGTTQVEDWVGGDAVRAAAVEEALASIASLTDEELEVAFLAADQEAAIARRDLRDYEDGYRRRGGGTDPDPTRERALRAEIMATDDRLGALRVERERRAWLREEAA